MCICNAKYSYFCSVCPFHLFLFIQFSFKPTEFERRNKIGILKMHRSPNGGSETMRQLAMEYSNRVNKMKLINDYSSQTNASPICRHSTGLFVLFVVVIVVFILFFGFLFLFRWTDRMEGKLLFTIQLLHLFCIFRLSNWLSKVHSHANNSCLKTATSTGSTILCF